MKTFKEYLTEQTQELKVGDEVILSDEAFRAQTTKIRELNLKKDSIGKVKAVRKTGLISSPYEYDVDFGGKVVQLREGDYKKVNK